MKNPYISLFVFLFILLFPNLNADVISLNSGGTENIILNPNEQIEGFFSCVPYTCAGLGYECDTWSDGCGGTLDCGTCASGYTCSAGDCTAVPAPAPSPGAAAAPGVVVPGINIKVAPAKININIIVNTAVDQTISVENLGTNSINVSVSQKDIENMVILDVAYLELAGKETKTFNARFVAPGTPGIYTGKIIVDGKEIPVVLNVRTTILLFDSNIVVLNKDYQVPRGDKLKTQVTLIPLGEKERLDVKLNYVIKDYKNKIYLTKSETLLVEDKVEFKRDFDTGMLPLGKYIIGLELIYSNGIAPSSAHFEVVEKPPVNIFARIVLYLMIFILIILILIILLLIIRYLKKRKERAALAA